MYTIPSLNGNNTFYQYLHPFDSTTSSTTSSLGFKTVSLTWPEVFDVGFRKSRDSASFFDISTGSNWYYPIGAKKYHFVNNTLLVAYANNADIHKTTNQLWIKLNPYIFIIPNKICIQSCNSKYFNMHLFYIFLICIFINNS